MMSFAARFGGGLAAGSLLVLASTQAPLLAQTAGETDQAETPGVDPDQSAVEGDVPLDEMPLEKLGAILQGLDKITARVSEFEAPIGETVRFGSFEIVVQACQKTPPEEPPESTAFLEITDVRPDEPARVVFKGWMFASSPALSAVEHPVYDVWVTGCRNIQVEAAPGSADEGEGETGTETPEEPAAQ
ncbi:DUF2155 domain-containing protein [Pelagibius sp. Alg239-R121]|uniref:DUF2155 domain-containing protein n=1 Tax=Pelagibius sp. Alg239-R121 TaxID=2993448 RepID=UPI0024A782DC|nr:DUF2155 domain-containing protein [Pelagibius sp. Alg239-R121]